MTGCCLALALAPLGLRVAMIEAVGREEPGQPSFDERSTALSRSSQKMFDAMELWPDIVAASVAIKSIHVSDRGSFGFSHIDASEQGVEALGYVVINRVLGDVLQRALAELDRVDVFCPARITAIEMKEQGIRVNAEEPGGQRHELSGSLLVGADGVHSTVRQLLGIPASHRDYGQSAITGNLVPEIHPDGRAWERFTPAGPLALLPLQGDRAAFIWTLSSREAEEVMQLADQDFLQRLQEEFGWRLGALKKVGQRKSYPLALTQAARSTASRTVLIGNAANGIHPVAAQGFNLGMRDVAALCDCIANAMAEADSSSIGSEGMLRAYAEWRRADHTKVLHFTDGIVRLFGSPLAPIRVLRALGMLGFDLIPGIRNLFARHTMGLAGRLPSLSRGVALMPRSSR